MAKTSKTLAKRIRVTKTGKLMRRKMGISHFRAKKSPKSVRSSRGALTVAQADVRTFKARIK